ncbi:transposase [Amycolatopsis mediterranei]|uniref:Mutator family transposase n=1 Tax=Amycolatopsis mediterranei (strain S699) TaxID=713604 RepID=A0A9R0U8Z0_AMYMS|nr:transposase [Amycolatopsis mediterranei S699]KDU88797.1 transposase [Amycolatopsis mediterranei]
MDEMVISLAAKGLTTGEISAHLAEVDGAEVSRQTISTITDKVVEGMVEWQNRPLDLGRFLVIVANDRGDQSMFPLLHDLVRALVVEALAWPVVELGGDVIKVVAGPHA